MERDRFLPSKILQMSTCTIIRCISFESFKLHVHVVYIIQLVRQSVSDDDDDDNKSVNIVNFKANFLVVQMLH